MEIIKSIREVFDVKYGAGGSCTANGYEIVTDQQTILILIDNEQSCCEEWGYLTSEDNLNDFIGAELLKVTEVDKELKVYNFPDQHDQCITLFINLETSKGTLQFVVYNAHNGYYGHPVTIKSNQLNINTEL
jgi:hypothetical protein